MRLDKRLLLSTLNEDFENRQAFEKGDFRCPLYTMRQATEIYKRLGLNAARSIFSSAAVDYKRYADQRDLSYSDIVPRWENPNEYTPSGSELLVPYRFAADNFPSEDINTIKTAIDSLTSQINGCITLYDDTDTTLYPHYINVKRFDENFIIDQGCWSYIGHVFWNGQNLNLGPNCLSVGTIQHEFLHALGFSHEQTRADRDDHIQVFFDNIKPDFANNYAKIPTEEWEDVSSPYDFTSVMHYGSDFFITDEAWAAGNYTMTYLNGEPIWPQRNGATSIDLHQLTYAYDGFCAQQVEFETCDNGDPLLPARSEVKTEELDDLRYLNLLQTV